VASVIEPSLVEVVVDEVVPASCFEFCDGSISVSGVGGAGNYTYAWSNGSTSAMNIDLCAGDYTVTVTDENGCEAEMTITITEPDEFIATAIQTQAVSCFEGIDGQATVTTNGNPTIFAWETGDDTPDVVGLSAGTYMVTVTNEDGCLDTTFVDITQPDSPVSVQIAVGTPISCAGEADGSLLANVSGPGVSFSYNWTNGSTDENATGLSSEEYSVTVSNELGCEAIASVFLDEPLPIQADISTIDITCLDPENGGIILIDTVTGGNGGYEYSLDGIIFSSASGFFNLFEGGYEIAIRDGKGCEEVFPVTVMGPPELVVDLGVDTEITQGEIVDLVAITNGGNNLVYTWTPVDSVTVVSDSTLIAQPIESTVFQVVVEDTVSFCTAIDQIAIAVNRDRKIFMANAFSPNNDGANDKFMVQSGVGVVQVKSFRVFDRYGAMVFEQTNFQPNDPDFGWDGQFNGRELNTGVYVFMAEIEFLDGLTEVFKGDVMLMR
jgi:gliding motility-associated-like protein